MRKLLIVGTLAVLAIFGSLGWSTIKQAAAAVAESLSSDPDAGPFDPGMSREEFMQKRAQGIALKRGVESPELVDPRIRSEAVKKLDDQEENILQMRRRSGNDTLSSQWTEIGPNPIPNGQVGDGEQMPVSGRTISIAVHPTDPNIAYAGTAQGGLYRTVDGGSTWTPLMDNALSLAIGAVAIAPSQPDTVYVGTGEANFSSDSFFGVGVYRIDNAASADPIVTGPLNKDGGNADVFTGRAIGRIIVHPTDPSIIFVSTTSGIGGIGGVPNAVLPSRGIYRSVNATSANPTFSKLTGLSSNVNASVRDMAIDPLNPNLLVANSIQANGAGGIYVSNDALSPSPTFAQKAVFTSGSTSELTAGFAVQHTVGPFPVIYAATGNLGGRLLMSVDGGNTWIEQIDNDFCGGQCFYNIAVAVDPTNPANVFLGGTGDGKTFMSSITSGLAFTASSGGLHTDSHVIAIAPSQPTTVYFGSDGGIYKSIDSGATWTSLNNSTFRATQFMSVAVHPTDPNFSIGGTQDNGTIFYRPDGTWNRADFGDGGNAVIDQNATDTAAVNMYHTYYNDTAKLQGYAFLASGTSPTEGTWGFRGCQTKDSTRNGITCTGTILFYAPLELGPGTPNTVYYGSDRLYRSADRGVTNTVVSQNPVVPGVPLSAIGISPQDDNVRIIGLKDGSIYGTTTGSSTLTNLDPSNQVPNSYVARAIIDPTNVNTAFVAIDAFGVPTVWKTTNLADAAPTWTAASGGLPQVPVNALVVDPLNASTLFAGTDIGVYTTNDGGTTWTPLGTGLPRVPVFDMAILPSSRTLRIATHGRGMWQIAIPVISVSVSGKVLTPDGRGLKNALVTITDAANNSRTVNSTSLGFFGFDNISTQSAYTIQPKSKRFRFSSKKVTVNGALSSLEFTGTD